jgi:hypothetical protein
MAKKILGRASRGGNEACSKSFRSTGPTLTDYMRGRLLFVRLVEAEVSKVDFLRGEH